MIDLSIFESNELETRKRNSLVYGRGINDSKFSTHAIIDGARVKHPAWSCWNHMLERCYSEKYHAVQPTYIGVKVCDDWLSFSNFYSWWKENYREDWFIDKDLLTGSRIYSPETCIFVPRWLNNLLLDARNRNTGLPLGVSYHIRLKRYQVRCQDFHTRTRTHLGYFDDPIEGGKVYAGHKLKVAEKLKPKMDEVDTRIYPRVVEIINSKR